MMNHRAVDRPYKKIFYGLQSGAVVMKVLSGAWRVSEAKTKVKVLSKLTLIKNLQ